MTGEDLHRLIFDKWGYSYDVQVLKIKDRIYFQVMWKYLQQNSFPLSETEYYAHLEQITTYLNAWGVVAQVETGILESKNRPRLGKAISINLDLGDRVSEWIL
ncbi:MAG: DUF3067 family protein [Cyanobacterium sp. T60_A2020_053]|nr:DUF3067 family protein [Cyanobacterium sp. T60_A2020_053]